MNRSSDVGVQTVVFQHLSIAELLPEIARTGIETVEISTYHLSADDDEATIAAAERAVADAGVDVCGHGVVDLADTGEARNHLALADRLGADYLTVNYPPDCDDVTAELADLADEFDLDVAIHNYSSVHHDDLSRVFSSIEDVRSVLAAHDHPRLGMCLDTGHFLVEEVPPEDVVEAVGDRIDAVHLKDTSERELEAAPGAGELDLSRVVGLLADRAEVDAPLVVEYELPPERATAALQEAEENVRAAMPSPDDG